MELWTPLNSKSIAGWLMTVVYRSALVLTLKSRLGLHYYREKHGFSAPILGATGSILPKILQGKSSLSCHLAGRPYLLGLVQIGRVFEEI